MTTKTTVLGFGEGIMPHLHRVPCCRLSSPSSHNGHSAFLRRRFATQTTHQPSKPTGDISSVFPSLSGVTAPPLPPRIAALKTRLVAGHEDALRAGWQELLDILEKESEEIEALGSAVIPEIEYRDIGNLGKRTRFRDGLRKRGVAVVRGVVSEKEALGWKELLKRYIKTNPGIKGRHMTVVGSRLGLSDARSRAASSYTQFCRSLSFPHFLVSRILLNIASLFQGSHRQTPPSTSSIGPLPKSLPALTLISFVPNHSLCHIGTRRTKLLSFLLPTPRHTPTASVFGSPVTWALL